MDQLSGIIQFVSDPTKVLAALAALMVLAHALEGIAKLTPTDADDKAVAKLIGALDFLLSFLPRFGRGGK
jgi:hypothetical protein